jgi:hypothetical protein
MTAMSPAMDTALAGVTATVFGAVEIVLPDATIRLLTGAGVIAFDGKTFTGSDPTYGVIMAVDNLTDGVGDEAPSILLTLAPASDAAAADLASAAMQGSQVTIWLGVVDPSNGLVIGEPLMIFLGMLDVATLKGGANTRTLDLEITSALDFFFFNDDGCRLSDTFHQYLWPGETGLASVTGILHQIYWGSAPTSGVTR